MYVGVYVYKINKSMAVHTAIHTYIHTYVVSRGNSGHHPIVDAAKKLYLEQAMPRSHKTDMRLRLIIAETQLATSRDHCINYLLQ
jgi:hypothetical protein